jgi:hypothetical protein
MFRAVALAHATQKTQLCRFMAVLHRCKIPRNVFASAQTLFASMQPTQKGLALVQTFHAPIQTCILAFPDTKTHPCILDWPTFGEIYIKVSRCFGVWVGMRKTSMCGFDWSLITVEQAALKVASSKVAKHESVF